MKTHTTQSPEETLSLAGKIATKLRPGSVLALHGDLGAGKTCFVQGLAKGLGVEEIVISPTYTLIKEYPGSPPLFHIDLYRIGGTEEASHLGLEEYFGADGIVAIEWAERAPEILPEETVHIFITPGETDTERNIRIENLATENFS